MNVKQIIDSSKSKLYNAWQTQLLRRPWVLKGGVGAVLIALLWGGYAGYTQRAALMEQSLVRPIPVMATAVVQRVMPVVVRAFGDLRALATANLSAQTAGDIVNLSFTGGQKVVAGDLLITIDNETEKAHLQKAQAEQNLKKIEYLRNVSLVERGAQPQQQLDIAKAELAVSQAETLAAEDALNKTYIKAPFSGRLGARLVSMGQYISPGEALVEIVQFDVLKVQFSVPERYLNQLAVAQTADITTDAYPGRVFSGKVDYVAPSIDPVTRTIGVEALIDNQEGLLSPGLSVQVALTLSQDNQALVVPEEALIYALEGPSVFLAVDDPEFKLDQRVRQGILQQQAAQRNIPIDKLPPLQIKKVKRINVQTGTFVAGFVQITQGLTADQWVVTQGQQKLRDGAVVMLVDPVKRLEEQAVTKK